MPAGGRRSIPFARDTADTAAHSLHLAAGRRQSHKAACPGFHFLGPARTGDGKSACRARASRRQCRLEQRTFEMSYGCVGEDKAAKEGEAGNALALSMQPDAGSRSQQTGDRSNVNCSKTTDCAVSGVLVGKPTRARRPCYGFSEVPIADLPFTAAFFGASSRRRALAPPAARRGRSR